MDPATPPDPQPVDPKPRGFDYAMASLVFGLIPCGITGVAGIVFGLIARSRIAKSERRRRDDILAKVGIVVSTVVTLFTVFRVILPVLASVKDLEHTIICVNNLKQIGLACRWYSMNHDEKYPTDFSQIGAELSLPKLLICPADTRRRPALNWAGFTTNNCSYPYFGGRIAFTNEDPTLVLSSCTNHFVANILLADGSVQQLSRSNYHALVQWEGGRLIYRGE